MIGAFYLTEKERRRAFDDEDEALIELLAAHAAIAITNARLYEQSRELSILSERNRLALELHDVVSQKLFSVMLTAEAAATQLDRDLVAARAQLERLASWPGEALDELRSLILGLRPPELERDGLAGALRKEVEMLGAHARHRHRARGRPGSSSDGSRRASWRVLRIAHEALHNAVRHASAEHVSVRLRRRRRQRSWSRSPTTASASTRTRPSCAPRHLGLTSMEERARELGGRLEIRSCPGHGHDRPPRGGPRCPDPIRVLLVDDHAVVREGLRDVPRAAGRDRDRRRGGRRRGGARRGASELRARRDPDGSGDAEARRRRARCASCAGAVGRHAPA